MLKGRRNNKIVSDFCGIKNGEEMQLKERSKIEGYTLK
jgi:hypothetical protein